MTICDGAEGFLRAHVKDDDYDDYQIAVERFIKNGNEDNALELVEAAQTLFETAQENIHEKKTEEYIQAQKKRDQICEMVDDIIYMRAERERARQEKAAAGQYEIYDEMPSVLLQIGCEMLPLIYDAGNGKKTDRTIKEAIEDAAMIFDAPDQSTIYALTRDENNKPAFITIRKADSSFLSGDARRSRDLQRILGDGKCAYELTTTSTSRIEHLTRKDGLNKFIARLVDRERLLYWDRGKSRALFGALQLKLPPGLPRENGYVRHRAGSDSRSLEQRAKAAGERIGYNKRREREWEMEMGR